MHYRLIGILFPSYIVSGNDNFFKWGFFDNSYSSLTGMALTWAPDFVLYCISVPFKIRFTDHLLLCS